ncbi:pro-Pol polyprotein [Trichonephila clavata]|uniref:Pro-Pol polyprotein n=1 Tax=Trichonephila clavata TaxID=2740835 RepID=A0A8X6FVW8_TRICU|nr:pro-Pol polyprotein [Trichonephila clavata]
METIFGWVVLGKTKISCQRIISNHASYNAVEFQLDKFWQLEELSETKPFTNEEIACENNFKRTYTRDSTGRFAVKFPFRDSSDELGSSRDIAVHRLQQIERRFSKNQSLSDQYHKFMDDYLKLGHMELIPENEIDVPASSSFYLPHHPVPNKNGDKFRVVFDGSAKSSSDISLNDKLMVGPQLQTDLTTLLLRFRMHKIAITADIEKINRQITLHDSDFQRIVWRNSPFAPIQDFRLTRIAYGTASAPYLAIKCLQQLALNESNNFPLASKAALKDFYVDDLMSGANSLSEALELQNQLTQMVSSAGLVLRKWASNCSEFLNSIDSDMRLSNTSLNIDNDDTVKTLGILWHPASDVFYFKITPLSFEGTLTKRTLLSTIAKTFDPLGWLSPITIQYKTIMQRLWKQHLQWDERVPTDIKLEWEQLANDVQFVKDIKIPRFLLVDSDNQFNLFGFSDASEKAYAAAIYCRSVSDTGKINVQLIIAKTRVAPLKTVSLPRLELWGALLLVKMMDFTCKALNYPISQAQFYTDSTIVLSWIGSHASRWKTFVANRVPKIQTLSSATQWHHISGSANPADLATRGVSSSTLLTSIWLCGPKFLNETFPFQTDSSVPALNDAVPEERYCTLQSIIVPNHLPDDFLDDISDFEQNVSFQTRVRSHLM